MLVLSRKEDQRIAIGTGIEVIVLEVRRGRVKLGITAPDDVSIHRAETRRKEIRSEKADRIFRTGICP
jgi:carbon storage regulator